MAKKRNAAATDTANERAAKDRVQVDVDPELAAKIDFITSAERINRPGMRKTSISTYIFNKLNLIVQEEYDLVVKTVGCSGHSDKKPS